MCFKGVYVCVSRGACVCSRSVLLPNWQCLKGTCACVIRVCACVIRVYACIFSGACACVATCSKVVCACVHVFRYSRYV